MQIPLWTIDVTDAGQWHRVEERIRQTFFADASVPCEALETAAYKEFRLRCRQALITDEPYNTQAALPSGYIVRCDVTRSTAHHGAVLAKIALTCPAPSSFDGTPHEARKRAPPSP